MKEHKISCIPTSNGVMNKQGYYVYSSNHMSCSITATTGGLGGSSGLYLIIDKDDKNALAT